MKSFNSSWVRTLLFAVASIGMSVAVTGCDWASVPGPW